MTELHRIAPSNPEVERRSSRPGSLRPGSLRPGSSRLTVNRRHTFRGKTNLDWFFSARKWVRQRERTVVEAAIAKRPLPAGEAGLEFLLLAPKRSIRRAHDRNRIKRWLREAVRLEQRFAEIECKAEGRSEQLVILLRISKRPEEISWQMVQAGVASVAKALE